MVMESLQRLDPPQALGKLTLLARLGEGGMAQVYVAAQGTGALARLCAVKLLRPDVADVDYRRRFLDEAALVVRLHHNNLVDVREAGEQDGQPYIVMELCEGRDLADLWDRCAEIGRAFPVPLSVYIVREALRGLHYAHGFGGLSLVHRDVSPSNLLVDWAGAVRVADFGLATSALKVTNTMPGLVFGKVGYMAPEQATRGELDGRADVYSCGVVLWELITGRPLREAGMDTNAVARFSATPPSAFSRRVDPQLDAIVVRALAIRPEDRYGDAGEFMRALSDWLVANAPQTDQEKLAEFMRGLFPDSQGRDHARLGELLTRISQPDTGVFRRGDTGAPTRELAGVPAWIGAEEIPAGVVIAERYRVEAALGRGGMGTVYLAEHVTVGRKVAVKVLTHEWSAHETVARRFREEARAASAAGHPNIIEVFDAGTLPDGRLYIVMEYLLGRSLYEELVSCRRLLPTRAVTIMRDVARAVAAAHAVGIIHRDLKPDNVMLVQRGDAEIVKVLDFGISASAERIAEDRRLTQPGHALGTPEYMAPEQAKGRAPTERVDVYAIGAMLYELLAGRPPFSSENFIEVLARKATEPAPSLLEACPDLSPALAQLVGDCLEIDPSARPRDAAEVLARLERLAEPGTLVPLVPQVPSPEPRVEQVVRVRATAPRRPVPPPSRAVPILAGVAAVALVAMIGALGWRLLRPTAGDGAERVGPGDDEGVPAQTLSTARAGAGPATGAPVPVPVPVPTVTTTAPSGADDGPAHGTGDATSGGSDDASAEPTVAPPETPTSGTRPTSVTDGARKPATVDSPACKATREAAETAKRAGEWSSVLVHVGTRGCWTGVHRNPALALRVRALFEKERFAECAKVGAAASDPAVKKLAAGCAARAAG